MRFPMLASLLAAIIVAAVPAFPRGAQAAPIPEPMAIGFSQGGQPLMIYHLGDGPKLVLLLGAQHGGPEANTYRLTQALLEHFSESPMEIPHNVTLVIMPAANPDGLAAGTRRFLSGVDPNRNWGGPSWQTDGYDSNGRFEYGLGGPEPFSEQETRALGAWVLANRPSLVVNYHSAGGFMFGGQSGPAADLASAYEAASGYWRPQPGGGQRVLGYRASGTMSSWLGEQGVPGIFIELTTPTDPEYARNLAGVRAILQVLAG